MASSGQIAAQKADVVERRVVAESPLILLHQSHEAAHRHIFPAEGRPQPVAPLVARGLEVGTLALGLTVHAERVGGRVVSDGPLVRMALRGYPGAEVSGEGQTAWRDEKVGGEGKGKGKGIPKLTDVVKGEV